MPELHLGCERCHSGGFWISLDYTGLFNAHINLSRQFLLHTTPITIRLQQPRIKSATWCSAENTSALCCKFHCSMQFKSEQCSAYIMLLVCCYYCHLSCVTKQELLERRQCYEVTEDMATWRFCCSLKARVCHRFLLRPVCVALPIAVPTTKKNTQLKLVNQFCKMFGQH